MNENKNEINEEILEIEEMIDEGLSKEELSNEEVSEEVTDEIVEDIIEELEERCEAPKKKRGLIKEIFDWVFSIVIALVAVVLINQFLLIQVLVDGSSMVPTLQDGDRLFAYRLAYEPKNGDIVVLDPNKADGSVKGKLMFNRVLYIKRVIATEGQKIDVKAGKVYVNDQPIPEDYIAPGAITIRGTTELPLIVPDDCVFVMGDNREHSKDSRDKSVGIVSEDQLVGKAVFRLFPFGQLGIVK